MIAVEQYLLNESDAVCVKDIQNKDTSKKSMFSCPFPSWTCG